VLGHVPHVRVARQSSIRSSIARIVGDIITQARGDERIFVCFVDDPMAHAGIGGAW
jgi:hypothetical protein